MYSQTDFMKHFSNAMPVNAQVFGKSLIVAPHPDDESLACGGTAAILLEMGISVNFVFVSDGTGSHPASKKYPAAGLRSLRESEARSAVKALGGNQKYVDFIGLPDGQLPSHSSVYFEAAVRILLKSILHFGAESIFVPWENDPHPDHQATYQIVYEAVCRMPVRPRIIQYPVWLWQLSDQTDIAKISQMHIYTVDITQTLQKKVNAISAHQSQITDLIDDDPNGFRLSEEMVSHFQTTTELFFESNLEHLQNEQC